jgi:hypothetical protein
MLSARRKAFLLTFVAAWTKVRRLAGRDAPVLILKVSRKRKRATNQRSVALSKEISLNIFSILKVTLTLSNLFKTVELNILARSMRIKDLPVHGDIDTVLKSLGRHHGAGNIEDGIGVAKACRLHGTGQDNGFVRDPDQGPGGVDHGVGPVSDDDLRSKGVLRCLTDHGTVLVGKLKAVLAHQRRDPVVNGQVGLAQNFDNLWLANLEGAL